MRVFCFSQGNKSINVLKQEFKTFLYFKGFPYFKVLLEAGTTEYWQPLPFITIITYIFWTIKPKCKWKLSTVGVLFLVISFCEDSKEQVQCDNIECPNGRWFHLECLKITCLPSGPYLCPDPCSVSATASLYCVCRRSTLEELMQCGASGNWALGGRYHPSCVGIIPECRMVGLKIILYFSFRALPGLESGSVTVSNHL